MKKHLPLALAWAVALAAGPVHAEDYISPTDDRVRLTLGITRTMATTNLRVDTASGATGTALNGESDLGLDRARIEPKFEAMVRASVRHRLRLDYFTLVRSDIKKLAQTTPVQFGNIVLLPGNPVLTDLDLRSLGITYEYSFIHRERLEVAGTFGLNVIDISARVRVQTPSRHLDQSEDLAGPYPAPGLDATWVVSRRFDLNLRGQYLKLSINNLDGSLGKYDLDALYRFRPNVYFGLGYDMVKVHLSSRQAKDSGMFKIDTNGPALFVRVAF